jgi:hypothetical protein
MIHGRTAFLQFDRLTTGFFHRSDGKSHRKKVCAPGYLRLACCANAGAFFAQPAAEWPRVALINSDYRTDRREMYEVPRRTRDQWVLMALAATLFAAILLFHP